MKKLAPIAAILASTLALAACQSNPASPVIQRANSTYETTGVGNTKVKAQENALANAQKTCRGGQVIIVDDNVKYNGILDERTGRVVGQVGTVLGAVLGTGSPNLSRHDDYEYQISFRCQ